MRTVFGGLRFRASLKCLPASGIQVHRPLGKEGLPPSYQQARNAQVEVKLEPEPLYNELEEKNQLEKEEEENYLTVEEHQHMSNSMSNLIEQDLSLSQGDSSMNASTSLTLEEILQLYARVDKSKKKNRLALADGVTEVCHDQSTNQNEVNQFCNNEECNAKINNGEKTSLQVEWRPLPPIPTVNDVHLDEDSENHIYATLPLK